MLYFSSDLHFGHQNILSYCDRPFSSVEEMNRALVERWNDQVSDADTVMVLGDVAMGKVAESLEWAKQLNGEKLLVPGNHDRCWPGSKGHEKFLPLYREAGFKVLPVSTRLGVGGRDVELCHFPFSGESEEGREDRYREWRPSSKGQWLFCGHVHDLWRQRGVQINVGIDAWGGRLVSEDQLASLIAAGPRELAPLAWD